MNLSHLSIATNGLAPKIFSHLQFALFGWASVEIIVTPITPYGGGSVGEIYDRYNITVVIHWNGKVIRRTYAHVMFDTLIDIVAKLKTLSIAIKHRGTSIINTVFRIQLNSINPTGIDVDIKERPVEITAKQRK